MSQAEAQSFIGRLTNRYLFLRFAETALLSVALGVFLFAIFRGIGASILFGVITASITFILLFIIRSYLLGIMHFKKSTLTSYLNRQYKDLEESADLLIENNEALSHLQQIQKHRAAERIKSLDIRLPHRLGFAVTALVLVSLTYALMAYFRISIIPESAKQDFPISNPSPHTEDLGLLAIADAAITITPPVYTQIKAHTQAGFNVVMPEAGKVNWSIQFTRIPAQAFLIFSDGDTLPLTAGKNKRFEAMRTFHDGIFYHVLWQDGNSEWKSSDYFKIDSKKDEAPRIKIDNLPQFIELSAEDGKNILCTAALSDDYGITDVSIVATVAKGSGESVKFREEQLRFDTPHNPKGKNVLAQKSIDLNKLGMEPGDELYFYVQAIDNREPAPNYARTETWFITLRDTASAQSSFDSGMGVDLMPEYFRSQRQIIIDTEKLLAEKSRKQVTPEDFSYRSNELGYDQKVLRLRYGQFLGEEFETSIGPAATDQEAAEDEEDPLKKFGHNHDKGNEHNLVKEKPAVKREEQEHNDHVDPNDPNAQENPLEAFAHQHDKGDEATFFVQSVKTKLKAALTLMWDAELQLRLYEPAKSLPYQYRILKLLKEISNDSRVYVHRNGFDPPPLKEDKRLTGDLAELKNTSASYSSQADVRYPAIREALKTIEILLEQDTVKIDQQPRAILLRAGNELAGIALEQPGEYVETLSLIKALSNNEIEAKHTTSALREIMKVFWNVLPAVPPSPTRKVRSLHSLDRSLIKHLQ